VSRNGVFFTDKSQGKAKAGLPLLVPPRKAIFDKAIFETTPLKAYQEKASTSSDSKAFFD